MRKWRRRAALLAGTGLIAWVACAAADERVRETRNIEQPFSQVRLAGNFDLELTQSDAISLVIEAAPEDLPNIRSDVDKGVLTVRRVDDGPLNFFGWFSRHRAAAARVLLSARAIDRLTLDGAGHIHAGPWTSESLEVRVSGAGDVKLDRLKAARFSCEVDGSGDVLLAGAVYNQRIVLSGSGRYRASDLKSQTATVTINGSAEVELWAEHKLDARISGSGDVRYYGAPAVTQSVSGSGRLTSLGAKNTP